MLNYITSTERLKGTWISASLGNVLPSTHCTPAAHLGIILSQTNATLSNSTNLIPCFFKFKLGIQKFFKFQLKMFLSQ
jgi:hypothetical protein